MPKEEQRGSVYEFGPFCADAGERVLRREGKPLPLTPKLFDTLWILVKNSGHIVDKQELMEGVWPETFVAESNLAANISLLRKLLGDRENGKVYIETVSRRGYRFVADVTERFAGQNKPFNKIKLTRITTNGTASEAAITPDGKYVVHVLGNTGHQSLWLRHIATGSDKEIVPTNGGNILGVTFSRDGNYIYFVREDHRESVLFQVPILGGEPKELGRDIDTVVSFSPDGGKVAFLKGYPQFGEYALMSAKADGSDQQKLVAHKGRDFAPFVRPAWSPRGDVIAAASRKPDSESGHRTIITVRISDGAEKTFATQDWISIEGLEWLPDGSGLLVIAADPETAPAHQIWYVGYESAEVRRINNDTNDYRRVSVTQDGSSFVTVQSETTSNLWVAPNSDAHLAHEITLSKCDGIQGLAWMPDGRIVYQSRANGNSNIWISDSNGQSRQPLTTGLAIDSFPVVTPDGLYILFLSNREGGLTRLWRMNSDGREPRPLTNSPALPFRFAASNQTVFFSATTDGKVTLWSISIDGDSLKQLTDYPAVAPVLSPDATELACSFVDAQALRYRAGLLGPEGGWPVKSLDLARYSLLHGLRWTPDGKALAYVDTRKGISNIWRLPLDGSPADQITDFKSDEIFSFEWSHDGQWLALARGSVTSNVVLVKDVGLS